MVDTAGMPTQAPARRRGRLERPARPEGARLRTGPWQLVRAAHPRLTLVTALGLAGAAALSGRPTREVGLVLVTALVGQIVLGWADDLADRRRDAADERPDKPLATGALAPGDLSFALACGVLALVPLAMTHGVWAGSSYLAAVAIGLLGTFGWRGGRLGWLSWLPWAASYALYPAFLAYGGWAGHGQTTPPEIAVTVLAAALGVCVHHFVALPGLVLDHENGLRHLPLRIALRIGAAKLLWATIAVTGAVLAGLLVVGSQVGLRQ